MRTLFSLLALVVLATACGARPGPGEPPPAREGYIALQDGGKTVLERLDDATLFRVAGTFYDRGQWRAALVRYEAIIEELPHSSLVPLATFNAGLCLKALGDCSGAIQRFRRYVATSPRTGDRRDALFHEAACLRQLEDWSAASAVYERLLTEELAPAECVEAAAWAGLTLFREGRLTMAERRAEESLRFYRKHEQLRAVSRHSPAVVGAYTLGEIYGALARDIRLVMPMERMRRDLAEKGALLLRAQEHYLRALRFQNRKWSVGAGVRLGELYEGFWHDLMGAELPEEVLGAEAEREYRRELREKCVQVLEKALIAYEQTLAMSQRMGVGTKEWGERAAEAVERLRRMMREQAE